MSRLECLLDGEFDPPPSPPRTRISLQPMSMGRRLICYPGLRLRIVHQDYVRPLAGGRDFEHRLERRLRRDGHDGVLLRVDIDGVPAWSAAASCAPPGSLLTIASAAARSASRPRPRRPPLGAPATPAAARRPASAACTRRRHRLRRRTPCPTSGASPDLLPLLPDALRLVPGGDDGQDLFFPPGTQLDGLDDLPDLSVRHLAWDRPAGDRAYGMAS